MRIFPAIDIIGGKAVRLLKGDYNAVTVYNDNPCLVARAFASEGAEYMHLVDLDGARLGGTPNLEVVKSLVKAFDGFVEIGGGIRNMDAVKSYIDIGVSRVILGTAAVTDSAFLKEALDKYKEKIAVGVDIKDGFVAIKGWVESADLEAFDFCKTLEKMGVSTIISTDISKDGAMQGTNHPLYERLKAECGMNIVASGGVSSLSDVERLRRLDLYGAIIGKAYYTGAISLPEAIEVAK